MTSTTIRWGIGFGGRIAHAWKQVGTYRTEFMALCNPKLRYGNGWDASGYQRCPKCDKLVNVQSSDKGITK